MFNHDPCAEGLTQQTLQSLIATPTVLLRMEPRLDAARLQASADDHSGPLPRKIKPAKSNEQDRDLAS